MPATATAAEAWWQRLPEDFFRQADGTELDADHRFKVGASAALDRALRSVLGVAVTAALGRSFLTPERIHEQMQLMQPHQALADTHDSEAVFGRSRQGIHVEQLKPRVMSYRPFGVNYRLLRFDSGHQPLNPELAQRYARSFRNRSGYAQYWFHRGKPRPTLVMVHGFGVDAYWFNAQMFSLRWFYKQGYDVLLYTMPFHGYRVERGDWFSGYGLFANGLPCFNEAIVHAVRDLRVLLDFLERRGAPKMGVSGLSLGGYTSALLATVDPRLAFCIPNSPVASIVDIAREWQPTGTLMGATLERAGVSLAELRHALAVHNPLTYAPKIDGDKVLVIGGAGDRFTPPRHVRLLHEHFPGSHLHWFPGNHLLHLHQDKYLRRMKVFMDRHCGLDGF